MKVTFFKDAKSFIKGDLSTSFTLGYLSLIIIGMLFNGMFYGILRINIFDYSDISDFLLAPFRDLFILVFTIISLCIIYGFTLLDEWMEPRFPKTYQKLYWGVDRKKFQNWYQKNGMLQLILFYIVMASWVYANLRAKNIFNQQISKTQVITKDNKFEPTDTLFYLGKTNTYCFFYIKNKKQSVIIPNQDVLRINLNK